MKSFFIYLKMIYWAPTVFWTLLFFMLVLTTVSGSTELKLIYIHWIKLTNFFILFFVIEWYRVRTLLFMLLFLKTKWNFWYEHIIIKKIEWYNFFPDFPCHSMSWGHSWLKLDTEKVLFCIGWNICKEPWMCYCHSLYSWSWNLSFDIGILPPVKYYMF